MGNNYCLRNPRRRNENDDIRNINAGAVDQEYEPIEDRFELLDTYTQKANDIMKELNCFGNNVPKERRAAFDQLKQDFKNYARRMKILAQENKEFKQRIEELEQKIQRMDHIEEELRENNRQHGERFNHMEERLRQMEEANNRRSCSYIIDKEQLVGYNSP